VTFGDNFNRSVDHFDGRLIGELRTNETMKLALQLASFGVLVFGTVHTNSAAATINASYRENR